MSLYNFLKVRQIDMKEETKKKISLAQKGRVHKPTEGFQKGHLSFTGTEKTRFKKGHRSHWRGKKMSEEHRKNLSINSGQWKGDEVGYFGLHAWVVKKLGKPRYCGYCQNDKKVGEKQYHWANISHAYRRDLSDWIRLCSSCHKLYDLGKIKL